MVCAAVTFSFCNAPNTSVLFTSGKS